jgi:Kef-type K+ transport system membrane component KefB
MLLLAACQETAVSGKAEEMVLHLLYQIIVILLATRIMTWVVRRLGQTDVSGEIMAGLLLGPSLLGAIAPDFMRTLFTPSTSPIFIALAQIGLILLMFQIGLEFEFRSHLGGDRKPVVAISMAGFVLPFVLGYVTAPWFYRHLAEPRPDLFGFQLFFAVAMSITAIPILGRIFMELRLAHTRTATLTIGAAAIDDVSGWLVLGAISMLVAGKFSLAWVLPRVGGLALFLAVVFLLLRPLLKRAIAGHLARHGSLQTTAVPWILLLLFICAAITSHLSVFAIIGGFVVGVALHDDREFVAQWKQRVGPLVTTFLLPIFFAYTGLRTDIGTLHGWFGFWQCFLVCLIAFVGKFGGAYVAARLVGEGNRSAVTIGICMNTRALMELIVLNIGKDMGILPTNIFTMLVIMALVSTFMATPLIRRLMRGQERSADKPSSHATVA